jgi:L-amino acid N-acyltransferase YncA
MEAFMRLRIATPDDAEAISAIYAPVVTGTAISFELEPPTADEMHRRLIATLRQLPWLVSLDDAGLVNGYAYAGTHRERQAYQWSVDTTVYVRATCRGQGVGRGLYEALLRELTKLGYAQAFAGIALPNAASIALHEAVGFKHIGVYEKVGFKLGAWRDVGWWQKALRSYASEPVAPRAFDASGNF